MAPKIDSTVFAKLTNVTNTETDRQTDHATPSVAIDRILSIECMRCDLIIMCPKSFGKRLHRPVVTPHG